MPKTKEAQANRVLHADSPRFSTNFFESDLILQDYIHRFIPEHARKFLMSKWDSLGERAACEMDELSLQADQYGPELIKRDRWGEDINEIRFHPAYWKLMDMAAESEMIRVNWDPECRHRFKGYTQSLSFISGYLYSLSEMGQYCPLCMTDGAALLISRYADEETKKRLMPGFAKKNGRELLTGAMYITEKSGGSDVGANLLEARHESGKWYRLYGEKWFCSNANAGVAMVLARTDPDQSGTRGLSLFLLEPNLPDGTPNPVDVVRLKEKMGVRSMASAECRFNGTRALLIGEEFNGMKMMLEMINLSRLYNSVAGIAGTRRALIEAYQFAINRRTFGKDLIDHALVREKLHELGALHLGNFLLVWRTIRAIEAAWAGDENEAQRVRMLIPMAKWWSAEKAVYIAREAMELIGGTGYIEDQVMPKLFRDVNVLPIWEGSGNIIVLDMLRAMEKSEGLKFLGDEIDGLITGRNGDELLQKEAKEVFDRLNKLGKLTQDQREATAKPLFLRLIHLYQAALIRNETGPWARPAGEWYRDRVIRQAGDEITPLDRATIEALMGWNI